MSQFLHDDDKAKAIAKPPVFSENSRPKKYACYYPELIWIFIQ